MANRTALAISIATVLFSGCGAPHDVSEKYYLIVGSTKSPYWEAAAAGLQRAAAELKVSASLAGPASYSPERQVAEFKRIVAMKPAGILVSATDPKLIGPEIDAAIAAGIPVITVDADAPGSKRLTFVGTNNYEVGLLGGRTAARQMNGKGNVMVFTTAGQVNLEERLQGYRAAFASQPGIQIAEVVDLRGDSTKAFDRASAVLESGKPSIDAFVSLEGQSPKELAELMRRGRGTGKTIIAMDALEPTLEAIAQGYITATIAQKPYTMAYFALRLLADIKLNKPAAMTGDFLRNPNSPMPRFVDTGSALIDKDSLAAYRESAQQAKTSAGN